MSDDPFDRIERIYDAVVDLPQDQRAAYLDQHCDDSSMRRQIESMLAASEHSEPLFDTPAMSDRMQRAMADIDGNTGDSQPDRIGRYHIVHRLGAGGMGIVYEAEQDNPRRRVALKVMRSDYFSRDMARRFEIEAHVLGQLHHPGIAQIYESGLAGSEDGRPQPYFAMELISGSTLHNYVRHQQCSTRDRLVLMMRIAEAVHHAHQKGVIHRDLKPDNILVDESGQPKVLDFGVARALDADIQVTTLRTDVGQIIGTLAYMSPEQLSGRPEELDTRSDVYALGVILYELLAGELPYDVRRRSVPDAMRMIQEGEPRRLSTFNAQLRGDLNTIVSKAIEKDKSRRYESAAQFAADIQRFLNDEPIVARPATTLYQLRKFAKRNKVLVGGVAAVFIVLIIGLIASTTLYVRAEANLVRAIAAEEDAVRESAVATEVSDFLVSLFEISDPGQARGQDITAREMLDRGAERILNELEAGSAVRGRLLEVMGDVYTKLGLYDEATPLLTEALTIYESLYESSDPNVLRTRELRARLHTYVGDFAKAQDELEAGLDAMTAVEEPDAELEVRYLTLLSAVAQRQGHYDESRVFSERALAAMDRVEDADKRREMRPPMQHSLAVSHSFLGNLEDAERYHLQAVRGLRETVGDVHPRTAIALSAFGLTLRTLGRLEEAREVLEESVHIGGIVWGEDSVNVTPSLNNLALVMQSLGRLDEAEDAFRRLVEVYEAIYGERHSVTALGIGNLASVLVDAGRYDEAEALAQHSLAIRLETLGEEHPEAAAARNLLVDIYNATARWPEAEAVGIQQFEHYTAREGETAGRTLLMLGRIAHAVQQQGRHDEARELFAREFTLRRDHHGAEQQGTLDALLALAETHLLLDEPDDAEVVLREHHAWLVEAGHDSAANDLAGRAGALYGQYEKPAMASAWQAISDADAGG